MMLFFCCCCSSSLFVCNPPMDNDNIYKFQHIDKNTFILFFHYLSSSKNTQRHFFYNFISIQFYTELCNSPRLFTPALINLIWLIGKCLIHLFLFVVDFIIMAIYLIFYLLFVKFSKFLALFGKHKKNNAISFLFHNFYSKERQFRVEQREADGSVKGEYGYIDEQGKMHLTKYSASEAEGFKAEQIPT